MKILPRHFSWFVVSVVGVSVGCSMNTQNPLSSVSQSASKQDPFVQANSTVSPEAIQQASTFNSNESEGVKTAMWENPVSKMVKGAFDSNVQPAAHPSRVVLPEDPLSLANEIKSPSPELFISMGRLAEHGGNKEQAHRYYQQALTAQPENVDAMLAYGHFQDRQGRLNEASKLYAAAVAAHPKHARAHNDYGLCLSRQKQHTQAVSYLRRAVELKPTDARYRNNLAIVLIEVGRPQEAMAELKSVDAPAVAAFKTGYFLYRQGQRQQATEYFALAVQQDPNLVEAKQWLAKASTETRVASPPPQGQARAQTNVPRREVQRLPQSTPPVSARQTTPAGNSPLPIVTGPTAIAQRPSLAPPPRVDWQGPHGQSNQAQPQGAPNQPRLQSPANSRVSQSPPMSTGIAASGNTYPATNPWGSVPPWHEEQATSTAASAPSRFSQQVAGVNAPVEVPTDANGVVANPFTQGQPAATASRPTSYRR